MSASIISDFIVPKRTGKAFKVNKGQLLRVIECEGKQVASLMFFNEHNYFSYDFWTNNAETVSLYFQRYYLLQLFLDHLGSWGVLGEL